MKIKFTRAPAIGCRRRAQLGSVAPLQGLVLIAGLFGALAAGMAGTGSPAVKAAVSPLPNTSTVAVAAVTTAPPPAGSYTALNPQTNGAITFYVSANQASLQDISIPTVYLKCAPGGASVTEPFGIATIPLASNGSFTATTTQSGVYAGYPATFTYTFRGSYQGLNGSGIPSVTGTFQETLTSTDSAARTCTSGSQSWTATRDTQPAQTTAPPPPGSYTALNPQTNGAITFYVSANQASLQDISIPTVYLKCAPGGASVTEPFGIATIPLASNGSFTATTTQSGVYAGYPATFTYTFRGNFHGVAPSGAARAAGTFKETLTYANGTAYTCTSNTQSWTATRDTQPAQTTAPPPPGSYTALNPQTNGAITFYVSANQASLQDISIPTVYLKCAPGGASVTEPFGIATIPLASNGSFTATTTQSGVYAGYPATFTYTFRGNFHGVAPSGAARAAGTFKETLTYANGTAYTCTSNTQSWTATRDTQPAQTTAPPPPGSYTALNPQTNGAITFNVSANQASLQDISIPTVYLKCAPGGASVTEPFGIATIPLASNGSFTATTTQSGVYAGYPATFTYTFRGNFHGVAPSGAARAAGTFKETLTYANGTAYTCTSNTQSWTATRNA